jgi:hypothetical protein
VAKCKFSLAASIVYIRSDQTPADSVDKLNEGLNAGLANPQQGAPLGSVPMPMPPAAFGKFMADETENWGKVIRTAGIKAR